VCGSLGREGSHTHTHTLDAGYLQKETAEGEGERHCLTRAYTATAAVAIAAVTAAPAAVTVVGKSGSTTINVACVS